MTNSLYERKFAKIHAGYAQIFLQKYKRYTGKQSNIQFFKNGKNCCFNNAITQFLDWPFNGISGLLKLELLSSDSFYCQGL